MLLAGAGVPFGQWRQERTQTPADLERFVEHVRVGSPPPTVLIDCTASSDIAARYPGWLAAAIHVVTPSKKTNSSELVLYRQIGRRAAPTV